MHEEKKRIAENTVNKRARTSAPVVGGVKKCYKYRPGTVAF
jgi:hypothetical protein